MKSQPRKYQLKQTIVLNDDSNIFLIYDAKHGNILEVNEIAFEIARFCKEPKTVEDIQKMIQQSYFEIPCNKKLTEDIKQILKYFYKKKILSEV